MSELPAGIEWFKAVSAEGGQFETGGLPGTSATLTAVLAPSPGIQGSDVHPSPFPDQIFGVTVNWPVTDSPEWVETSDEVKMKAAITRYALYRSRQQEHLGHGYTLVHQHQDLRVLLRRQGWAYA